MQEEMKILQERYELTIERISSIMEEDTVPKPFDDYFRKTASFLFTMKDITANIAAGETKEYSLAQWEALNREMYRDILPDHYSRSYADPAYAVRVLGETHGRVLSFLYTELRGIIVYAFEQRLEESVILHELFIEIYNSFEQEEQPTYRQIQQIIYWFISDYSDLTVTCRIREALDPELNFAADIIMNADLEDLRYLYRYGEYISDNERQMAMHMNSLPQETIDKMASVYTEGYRIGFQLANIDLTKKKTVNIRYTIGFERMIRAAIENFRQIGLEPVIYRAAVASINKRQHHRIGYQGGNPNKQYDYDHRADQAIYLDKPFVERKLGVLRAAYEQYRELAAVHAGPACVETFGETPFVPVNTPEAYYLSEKQQKLSVYIDNESAQITNQYIPGDERSFTIIAFPVPEIGENFAEIFNEIIKINTLDYHLYRGIQACIIAALDKGEAVHILGRGGNHTDLTVKLHQLTDPRRQSNFENCVSDVNIPVGEVFTSPVLKGTNGVLEVSQVYLNELRYENLRMVFEDGMITDYSCSNFDTEADNKKYIMENVLHHHETLPMGEFAIGTNTTAYRIAREYQIAARLPILIAEKMGPHFAVGDTCYSWSEDNPVYNPDGKEIIARDNEVSILRKTDVGQAYFGCHTDITIPYEELALIEVICPDGERIPVIAQGRFVLAGTEQLNKPLDQ